MKLVIVVPCYNEEEVLNQTSLELENLMCDYVNKKLISDDSYVLYVDDGSRDRTWEYIESICQKYSHCHGLKLAANVGHQNALLAGLHYVKDKCDISVSIDADLQDDISVIEEMINKYQDGYEIVYGVRKERSTDTFFKRFTAESFYKLMHFMGVKSVFNHADFRLMSSRALQQLSLYKERNLFLRGMVPLIGYKTSCVYYARKERMAGESKYPLKKMLSFAFDGITSFSIKPISFILGLGIFIVLCSCMAIIYTLISYLLGWTEPGWSSIMLSIWFLGGVQLLSIGLIGEYIGKVYVEVKERPRYNIEKIIRGKDDENNI